MNKNKIFIITGALLFGLFIALLVRLQTIEGQPNDLQDSYTIEIFNCSPIAKNKTDVMNELNAALRSTGSNRDGVQICHVPILNINDVSFGIPIYGMNYFRLGMGTDMYLYEDREADETEFFKAADKNEKYLELQKIASKGWYKDESKVILDWTNNRNEFIISPSQKEKHSKNKKEWKSFLGLRGHIDSLIKIDKSEKNIKVYYFCGSIIDPMLDDDGDGIINSKDSCPQEKGSIERNGCPPCSDGDKDGICDTVDKCPNVRGDRACDGCVCPPPIVEPDYDNDGIPNSKDACSQEFGFRRYKGCPIPDTDGDGVNDEIDKCPKIPGPVSNKGCPLDIKITHNNKIGKFMFPTTINFNDYNVSMEIKQSNGKIVNETFSGYICPTTEQAKKIIKSLSDPVDLVITVVIKDKNGKEIDRNKFYNLSMICFSDMSCGFVDLDKN